MPDKSPEQWRLDWEKRRARQEQRDRVRRVPFIDWPNQGTGWCRWCGEMVIDEKKGGQSKRASWHKPCVGLLYLHSRLEHQFAFVAARDGLRCAWPGCGATPERWHRETVSHHLDYFDGARGLDIYWSAKLYPDVPWKDRTDEERNLGAVSLIERRSALQLDHRVPLWFVAHFPPLQRRSYFGPDNLWLLCPAHHKAKTRHEAAERAKSRAV